MIILCMLALLLVAPSVSSAQTADTLSSRVYQKKTADLLGLAAMQVGVASVGFVAPIAILMPGFIDSSRDRNSAFLVLPLSVSVAGLLLGTNLIGEMMGGEDNYGATILGAGLGFVVGTRGWTEHPSRTSRYIHFSAPIIVGAVGFYWLANAVFPSSSVKLYPTGNAGVGMEYRF